MRPEAPPRQPRRHPQETLIHILVQPMPARIGGHYVVGRLGERGPLQLLRQSGVLLAPTRMTPLIPSLLRRWAAANATVDPASSWCLLGPMSKGGSGIPVIWMPVYTLNHVRGRRPWNRVPCSSLAASRPLPRACSVCSERRRRNTTMTPVDPSLPQADHFEVLFWRRPTIETSRETLFPATTRQAERSLTFSSSNGGSQHPCSSPHSHHHPPETHLQWTSIATLPRPISD